MRILYHFPMSPFSRRTRLALAVKGVTCELRDARAEPSFREEAKRLSPLHTIPVLVEEDGVVIGDSTAISHYLDRAFPDTPPLWPAGAEDAPRIFRTASLVDGALNTLIDLGTRYYALREHDAWGSVKGEMLARAQGALEALAEEVKDRPTIARAGFSAADIWLFTAVVWLEGLPARAPTFANAAQVMSLGFTLPEALSRWADAHRNRADVQSLG
jgi:glutathione S-transferase